MVKETRIVFNLSDIKRVKFSCASCNGHVGMEETWDFLPHACPWCNRSWDNNEATQHANALLKLLTFNPKVENPSVVISLEIDGE